MVAELGYCCVSLVQLSDRDTEFTRDGIFYRY